MRKILFRGRVTDWFCYRGEWIKGDLKSTRRMDGEVTCYIQQDGISQPSEVDPETIGSLAFEATDVHPEIWEGDIIEDKDGYRMKVMHDPYRRTFNVITNSISGLGYEALDDGYLHFKFKNRGAKVVGNIHDNPELFREPLTFCEYAPKGQTN